MQIQWSAFWRVCFSMCVGVMGTALASPLYPLYQALWSLKPSDITSIFVVYMVGVLVSLLSLANLSNRFGFLPVLRAGLMLMTLGMLLSAVAWRPAVFVLARLAIGLASGMITTSASIGLMQLGAHGEARRTSSLTTFAMTLGFGLGPLVGGLIAQWTPHPLVSAYLPSLLLGLLATWLLFGIPPHALGTAPEAVGARSPAPLTQWLPRITLPPTALRRPFWIASTGAFMAFGMFSLYASLAPSFMQDMLPWHGPAVSGLSISTILFLSSGFQLLVRNVQTKHNAIIGMVALTVCNGLLVLTSWTGSTALFLLSVFTTALGHGLACLTGMTVVNKLATAQTRGGLLSSYLVVAYMGTIAPILAVGWLSDHLGLARALVIFCTSMAMLSAALAWGAWETPPVPAPEEA